MLVRSARRFNNFETTFEDVASSAPKGTKRAHNVGSSSAEAMADRNQKICLDDPIRRFRQAKALSGNRARCALYHS